MENAFFHGGGVNQDVINVGDHIVVGHVFEDLIDERLDTVAPSCRRERTCASSRGGMPTTHASHHRCPH